MEKRYVNWEEMNSLIGMNASEELVTFLDLALTDYHSL